MIKSEKVVVSNSYAKALGILSSFYVVVSLITVPLVGNFAFVAFSILINFIVIPLPLFIPAATHASCLGCIEMNGVYLLELIALPLGLLGVYGARQLAKGNKRGKYIWIFLVIISFSTCIYNFTDYYYLRANYFYYGSGLGNKSLLFTSAFMAISYLVLLIAATSKKPTQTPIK